MNDLSKKIEAVLPLVSSPAQYVGGELHSVVKDPATTAISFALAFPDTYTIGMSHLGMQILYSVMNGQSDIAAERVFAPWMDMEEQMRANAIPLFSLESRRPIREFDIVGFSLQYEMCFTTALNMLELAGIPLKRTDRAPGDPLVVAGGPCAFNPEPMADFVDIFLVGDCEQSILKLTDAVKSFGNNRPASREEFVRAIARADESFYSPADYEPIFKPDGTLAEMHPLNDAPEMVRRATVKNLADAPAPKAPLVPFVETVHDRITIEIMRGCPNGCRFCQAGRIKKPVRCRTIDEIVEIAKESYENTGHEEIALVSLSSSDYPDFENLLARITTEFAPLGVSISLPSLRVNEQLRKLPKYIKSVRKSGLTLAPEAATDELRARVNKRVTNEDLYAALGEAYQLGWKTVKLYYMIGLPGETESDVDAIIGMLKKSSSLAKDFGQGAANINASISTFVPKAFTPLEREPMIDIDHTKRVQRRLRDRIRSGKIRLKFHKAERSFLEGIFARGDRRLGDVLLSARKKGCNLDAWDEMFDFQKWTEAFAEAGLDPRQYACRELGPDEILPWSRIS